MTRRQRRERMRRRRRRRIMFYSTTLFLFVLLVVLVGIFFIGNKERVKASIKIEAGEDLIAIEDFLIDEADKDKASFVTSISDEDMQTPGTYPITIQFGKKTYESEIKVVDTTPPTADIKNLEIPLNQEVEPDDFVVNIIDVSDVSVDFKETPDFQKAGDQDVVLILKDTSDNQSELTAKLTITPDTEPPVITGAQDQIIFEGETISYRKGVTVTDNIDEEVELEIDNSKVKLQKAGTYGVVYTATDSSGNTTSEEITVTVRQKSENAVDEETLFALADDILSGIIDDSMSQRDKAWAIYEWVTSHISYTGNSDKSDWITGAYTGFNNRIGDCFTYFSVAKALLTRAGIDNLDVTRVGGETKHYWHLVDVGEGWYHFDTTPQKEYLQVFLLTDKEVADYTAKVHRNYYTFDESLYPERGN
jgi:transglutaminase-like putative cysteine protease